MNELERAIVDLVRMGMRGDVDSVRQYSRRLLKRAPAGDGPEGEFRAAIGDLLLQQDAVRPALRRGAAPAALREDTASRGRSTAPAAQRGARSPQPADIPFDAGSALRLARVETGVAAEAPVLGTEALEAITSVLQERRRSEALSAAGVAPSRTVLLTGAPGVGKTMTARYIAADLGLPLVTVDLAAVMSSFLGKTGQNLRQVLDFAREHACVLLLDEFDALAKRRDDQSDVGELKRIVNVLLMELETWPEHGLLLAATNHPELLDPAVWRRFDVVIALDLPDTSRRRRILTEALSGSTWGDAAANDRIIEFCALATEGMSGSDLARLVRGTLRSSALSGRSMDHCLADAARAEIARGGSGGADAERIARIAHQELGWTQRSIAQMLGVTHPTVGTWLKRADSAGPAKRRARSRVKGTAGGNEPAIT
ncbi:AAA family ATPase [Longimicrobium sp.]|uniref:AAA family ATPase n=1 Tax=Longimicrobium sp. TaxID=2029185 RepID=UPI003B3B986F